LIERRHGGFVAKRHFATAAVLLKRYTNDDLAPADRFEAFAARAGAAISLEHPHLVPIHRIHSTSEAIWVEQPLRDADDLKKLVGDFGPLPTIRACEFVEQAARGLAHAHAAGVTHGDIRPHQLLVGPLVPSSKVAPDGAQRFRPSAEATVTVADLGLVPERTRVADWPPDWSDRASYLAPERRDSAERTPRGDVWSLAATFYFLMTGHRPTYGPLGIVRPDCPPDLIELYDSAIAVDPELRTTMDEFADRFASIARRLKGSNEQAALTEPLSAEVPIGSEVLAVKTDGSPTFEPAPVPTDWQEYGVASSAVAGGQGVFVPEAIDESSRSTRRRKVEAPFSRKRLLILAVVFVGFNILALLFWLLVLNKPAGGPGETDPKSRK